MDVRKTSEEKYTDDELLAILIEFNAKQKRLPQRREFTRNSDYPSSTTYQIRFGSWNEALKKAGLRPKE
ncbi:TPA: hypothetical protein H1008_00390 [archaeon]|nr:hypothetical protein [Candidatus Undinarchaeales archaeon SRR5007147.bin71]